MTPRVDAWMRQANSDWAVAELTAQQGFHSQACYHYCQAAEKALKALLISLGSLPPYSHALDRLVDSGEPGGFDVSPIRTVRLKALSRMDTETRYLSDNVASADRFDAEDSAQARTAASQVMAFTQATITPWARYSEDTITVYTRVRAY
ncbi:MAG: HEPN domain-containing protein [Synechococcus sp. YX04-3]|nr:MAG: HEPN domain-containing protein [Synechococcus sp. YX04-3]